MIVLALRICTHKHTHTLSFTITHISGICKHITMNELTFYHITLSTHCLKTLTSFLHPQKYACVDEYTNCSVDWMPYYILHRYNGPHHYVCIYGLSDYSCYCMPYHILHSYTGSLHYVCVDVLLDNHFDWMPYTHFTLLWMLTNMYAFMSHQMTPVNVCLITHITNIMTLTTV